MSRALNRFELFIIISQNSVRPFSSSPAAAAAGGAPLRRWLWFTELLQQYRVAHRVVTQKPCCYAYNPVGNNPVPPCCSFPIELLPFSLPCAGVRRASASTTHDGERLHALIHLPASIMRMPFCCGRDMLGLQYYFRQSKGAREPPTQLAREGLPKLLRGAQKAAVRWRRG